MTENQPVFHVVQPHSIFVQQLTARRLFPLKANYSYHPKLSLQLNIKRNNSNPQGLLGVSLSGDAEEQFPFELELQLAVQFDLPPKKDISDEELLSFLKRQSLLLLWPYARTYIGDLLAKMGLPPLILPWINVEETAIQIIPHRDDEENEQQ